jgi:hypothetical protein
LLGGVGYALLGSSRQLAIGPTSAISLMIADTVAGMADGDAQRYAQIASLAAMMVALFCLIAWLLRLSILVRLISESGTSDEGESSNFTIHGQNRPGGNIMKRALTALALAGTLAIATIATPTSAHAQWRRGWGWGLGGLALGLTIGAALSRPAYAYGYGYPAYSYGYGYPGYGYGYPAYSYASYGYGYPAYGYGYGGGYYRPAYRSAYYGGYRPAYRPAVYGGYRVARGVAIHRARWR